MSNSLGGATLFDNTWGICEVAEIARMIEELNIAKAAIEEETGIVIQ